jgi:hypothetical protein
MRIAMTLEKLMDKQILLAQAGMEDILIDAQAFYNAVQEWLRISDIEVPERYVLDPNTDKAKAAFANKAAEAKQAKKMQQDLMQQAVALEQVRIAFEKYKTDAELQFKYYDAVLSAQVDEAKIAAPAVVDLMKARQDAENANSRGKKAGSGSASEEPAASSVAK